MLLQEDGESRVHDRNHDGLLQLLPEAPLGSLKGKTPAMAAGLTENVWSVSDLLSLDMWFAEKVA